MSAHAADDDPPGVRCVVVVAIGGRGADHLGPGHAEHERRHEAADEQRKRKGEKEEFPKQFAEALFTESLP